MDIPGSSRVTSARAPTHPPSASWSPGCESSQGTYDGRCCTGTEGPPLTGPKGASGKPIIYCLMRECVFLKRGATGTLRKRNSVWDYFERQRLFFLKGRTGPGQMLEGGRLFSVKRRNLQSFMSRNREGSLSLGEFGRAWGTTPQEHWARGSPLAGSRPTRALGVPSRPHSSVKGTAGPDELSGRSAVRGRANPSQRTPAAAVSRKGAKACLARDFSNKK